MIPEWARRALFIPEEASSIAGDIDRLHLFVFSTSVFGTVMVFLVTFYALAKYRQREPGGLTEHRTFDRWSEALTIGGMLTLFMTWWILGYRSYVEIYTPPPDTLDIWVSAKQWMWKFVYPDGTNSLGTLVVPQGRAVRMVMISRDVIHSFFVPAFRIKQDVLPGRYTTTWFEPTRVGTYPLFCAEYCGFSHSTMRAQVVVLAPEDYATWSSNGGPGTQVSAAPSVPAGVELAGQGVQIAASKGCFGCHSVDGAPRTGPTWRGLYDANVTLADGSTVTADPAYLTQSMMDPTAALVAGYSPVMPSYRGQLSAGETAALVTYIRSLREP